jgi:multidrug efflux system membrane fusion protein
MATVPLTEERPKQEISREPRMETKVPHRKGRGWVWLIILAALAYGIWHYRGIFSTSSTDTATTGSGRGGRGGAGGTVPVAVATATKGDIPVYLRAPGTVAAFNTVTVHTRVDGQLMSVAFKEGQFVHEGEVLAELDPRPFQVTLEQAEGQLAHDEALLKDAQLNAERFTKLYNEGVLSQQQANTQQATAAQYIGAIKTDQGMIDSAKLNITYCRIISPISGRIGLRLVDAGNIVHAADANGLIVITQLQPISVLFSLPQDDLAEVNKQVLAGTQLPADAFDRDTVTKIASGKVTTIDNQIDQTTDTYKVKTVFPNENNALFPNQFVQVRLLEGKKTGLTIVPPAAIQRGPQGTFVYVVTDAPPPAAGSANPPADNSAPAANGGKKGSENGGANGVPATPGKIVKLRQVTVSITEGDQAGISAGLQPGEIVVIDGMDKLQDGTKVDPRAPAPTPAANSSTSSGYSPTPSQNPPATQPAAKSGKSKKSKNP